MHLEELKLLSDTRPAIMYGDIMAGVNDDVFNTTSVDDENAQRRIDIGLIEKAIQGRFSDRNIRFTIGQTQAKSLKNSKNGSGRGILVQSRIAYSNASDVAASSEKISLDDWRETFAGIAIYLMGLLDQDKVAYWFTDIATGKVESLVISRKP